MSDLIPINLDPETINPLEVFQPDKVTDILNRIKEQVDSFKGDASTQKGRDEIASFVYKIRRSKTMLDDLGKNLVADWKEKSKSVDKERKRVRDTLDEMIEATYKPVQDYKDAEEARQSGHKNAILRLSAFISFLNPDAPAVDPVNSDSFKRANINRRIEALIQFYNSRDFEEFSTEAKETYINAKEELDKRLQDSIEQEKKDAELEELRKKEEQRKAEESRLNGIKDRIELLKKRLEELPSLKKLDLEFLRKKLAEDSFDYGEFHDIYTTTRTAIETLIETKIKEIEVQEAQVIADQERAKLESEQAAKDKAQADADAARERDIAHKRRINTEAREAIYKIIDESMNPSAPDQTQLITKAIVKAIADGKVPHVSIKY